MAPREQSHLPHGLCLLSALSLPYKRTVASGAPSRWWELTNPHQSWEGSVYIWKGLCVLLEDEYRPDHKTSIFTPKKVLQGGVQIFICQLWRHLFLPLNSEQWDSAAKGMLFHCQKVNFSSSLWNLFFIVAVSEYRNVNQRKPGDLVKFHRTEKALASQCCVAGVHLSPKLPRSFPRCFVTTENYPLQWIYF